MRRKKTLLFLAGLMAVLLLSGMVIGAAWAQSGGGFDLHWNVIAGGGGNMTGSGYTVSSTIGQNVVGSSSGSGFMLGHGYWFGFIPYKILLPMIIKQ
jgi:hypothetical protein